MKNYEKEEMINIINDLMDQQNIMNPKVKLSEVLNEVVSKQHRTIQQSFVKNIHDFLVSYSDNSSDLRNEASINFAKSVKKLDCNFPFI